ncbi:hypothetical protein F5H01DRAFT_345602 [Linnemannia elongata]|nr:hypothetical protein F5H01DRAFT_345602 [Linnemannia elongata]
MHPPTPTVARSRDQPSSSSSRAAPLSQYPIRTTSTAYVSSLPYKAPQTTATLFPTQRPPCHCDLESERQRHLRQNQDIIRLLSLKSIQIRRSDAEISQLERTNLELTVALHRAQRELEEKSTANTASLHYLTCSPTTANLQEEWIQLSQTQQAITYLQQHIEPGLPPHHTQPNRDCSDCERDYASDADLMLSLTPRSKKRKLESLTVSRDHPRDLAMIKLEHIRAIYQHEQNALVEVMRSHRSTTELYKETLRILSEDRECSNSNEYTSISGRSHTSQPDQRFDQLLDPSRYFSEALLLPSDRSAQPSTALVTPPHVKRARVQQTPSPLPFFNMDTETDEVESDLTNPTPDFSRPLLTEPAQVRCERAFTSCLTSLIAEGVGSESQRSIFHASTEPAPQISNNSRESARRLKRPVSGVGASILSNISEQVEHFVHVIADTIMSESSQSESSLDVPLPAPRQSIDPQDLIVGNQKPQTTPATPRTPKRQLMTSPYRRQETSSTIKVSPSAAARRDSYLRELAKAKAQSKKLVAMFKKKGAGAKASTSSETSFAAKSEDTGAVAQPGLGNHANKTPSSTETESMNLTMTTSPTDTKTAAALGKNTSRSPSRIPRAIGQQRRSGSTRSLVIHRSGIQPDKLKSLTAGQLLRRMNKSLLGSTRLPVLPRKIVQKGVSSNVHLAPLTLTAKGLSSTISAITIKSSTPASTPASTPNMASSPLDAPPPSTAATAMNAEAAANHVIHPPVKTMTKAKATPKPSPAVAVKSRRVTRSILSDNFRRVTRSATAAASQIL